MRTTTTGSGDGMASQAHLLSSLPPFKALALIGACPASALLQLSLSHLANHADPAARVLVISCADSLKHALQEEGMAWYFEGMSTVTERIETKAALDRVEIANMPTPAAYHNHLLALRSTLKPEETTLPPSFVREPLPELVILHSPSTFLSGNPVGTPMQPIPEASTYASFLAAFVTAMEAVLPNARLVIADSLQADSDYSILPPKPPTTGEDKKPRRERKLEVARIMERFADVLGVAAVDTTVASFGSSHQAPESTHFVLSFARTAKSTHPASTWKAKDIYYTLQAVLDQLDETSGVRVILK